MSLIFSAEKYIIHARDDLIFQRRTQPYISPLNAPKTGLKKSVYYYHCLALKIAQHPFVCCAVSGGNWQLKLLHTVKDVALDPHLPQIYSFFLSILVDFALRGGFLPILDLRLINQLKPFLTLIQFYKSWRALMRENPHTVRSSYNNTNKASVPSYPIEAPNKCKQKPAKVVVIALVICT